MATEIFRRYGRQVAEAQLVGGVLELPDGFLGEEVVLPLWFHPNYHLLKGFLTQRSAPRQAEAQGRKRRRNKRQFHLVATPGIGKTYFGHYWFYEQAKEKKRVMWRTKAGLFLCYDFSLEDPFVHASRFYSVPGAWEEEIKSIWLVVDGACTGVDHPGFVLQCVSPGRDKYHEFSKDVGQLCHLEAWSLDELMECRDALNLDFSDAQLAERFYYCGGVPREIFDDTKGPLVLRSIMSKAVARAPSWEAVIRHASGEADKDPLISDYLLHYQLPKELDMNEAACDRVLSYTLKFGSAFVEDLVFDRYQSQSLESVRRFFDFCQEIPEAHQLSGKLFERRFVQQLKDGGGVYKAKDLSTPGSPTFSLEVKPTGIKKLRRWQIAKEPPNLGRGKRRKPSKEEKLRGLIEVQFSMYNKDTAVAAAELGNEESVGMASLEKGCFVYPYSASFKALDMFVVPDMMFQSTYSLEHKLFWAPILEVVQEYDLWHTSRPGLTPPPYYQLIFVVPDSQFREFKFQGYKKEDGTEYVQTQPEMARVKQLAISVSW